MKNIFKTLTFAALFSLICGCTKTDIDDTYNQGYTTLSASLSAETRTSYSGDKSVDVVWSAGDAITLYGNDGNLYQLSLCDGAGTSTASFAYYGILPPGVTFTAVYPASTAKTLEDREAEWQTNLKTQSISTLDEGKLSKYAAMKGEVTDGAVIFEQETFLFRAVFDETTQPLSNGTVVISDSEDEDLNITLTVDSATEETTLYAAAQPGDYTSVTLSTADYIFVKDINTTLYAGKVISLNLEEDDVAEDLSFTNMVDKDGVTEYYITSAADLKLLSDKVVSGGYTFEGASFKMTRDIDLGGFDSNGDPIEDNQWTPIGNSTTYFKATFDGCGYEVSGIYINGTSSNQGLFGHVYGASISNLGVSGTITGRSVGGVVGYADRYSTVTSCYNTGKVSGSGSAGGVVGYAFAYSNVTSCYNTGEVVGSGGVVGEASAYSNVTSCYNTGKVSGNNFVGGVVGTAMLSSPVTACYNTGEVSGSGYNVGGVVGSASESTVKACYNTGKVSGSSNVGGVVGLCSYSTVTACYYLSNIKYNYGTQIYTASALNDAVSEMNSAAGGNYFTANSGNILPSLFDEQIECDDFIENMTISNLDELKEFRDLVSEGNGPITATLTANIDIGDESWSPIGTSDNPYCQIFDGGGYTISGLYINSSAENYQGLFGCVSGGTIKNLMVKEPNVAGNQYVGAVCGYISGGEILDCAVEGGEVSGSSTDVGGIVGYATSSSTVTSCYNTSAVSGTSNIGGVVGYAKSSTVTACYNTSEVSGSSYYVGGVVGYTLSSSTVKACYNTGKVSGSGYYVGGVVGYIDSSTITTCYYLSNRTYNYIYGTQVYSVSALNDAVSEMNSAAGENYFTANSGNILPSLFDEQIECDDFIENMTISNLDELKEFRNLVSEGNSPITATLTANIDIGDESWSPIGTLDNPYYQIFDGGGYTISGLYINSSAENYQGLFGYVSRGTIKNLMVKEPNVAGNQYVGAVCGYISVGEILDCVVEGGTVSGSGYYVGGVVGYTDSSSTVTACYNTSAVSGTSSIGGVVGYAKSSTVTACYNTSKVSGNSNIGGVVGYCYSSTVTACYYLSDITYDYGTQIYTVSALNDAVSEMNSAAGGNYFTANSGNILPSLFDEQIECDDFIENMTINNLGELKEFRDLVNKGNSPITATLTANIDIGNESWSPIGTSDNTYYQIFDGGGYTISGLYINSSAENYQGLFGYVSRGTIKNLMVKEPNVAGNQYVGAVCGYISVGEILDCVVEGGTVSGSSYYVGGVVGYTDSSSTVTACYNTSAVSGTSYYVGGVVGYAKSSTVTACYNTSEVSGSSYYVGGVVGYTLSSSTVKACYNTGKVSGSGYYVGGVVGYFSSSSYSYRVTNCYNTGEVNGSSSVGGVVGYCSYSSNSPTNCYYIDTLTGLTNSYGTTETEENMKSSDFVTTLNNGGTDWQSDYTPNINSGYPILSWQ